MRKLTVAVGDYPHTAALKSGEIVSEKFAMEFSKIEPIHRAFAIMAHERGFDVSEMPIATLLQAIAQEAEITALPVVTASRFQEPSLLVRADSTLADPAALKGKRVGVRAYSQTTGLWLRGILRDDFGLAPSDIHWTTFEDGHVPGYAAPPFVSRAEPGREMLEMLRVGELDAAIVGGDPPDDASLRSLFPDPQAAGEAFYAHRGFVPVNHVLVVKRELAQETGSELCRIFAAAKARAPLPADGRDRAPIGRNTVAPAFRLAIEHALDQGLIGRRLDELEIWRDSPADWL